ncbi:MAG: 3-oxoacyl-[acyl-carrier-protein] reductase [Acidobacteria bacterium]|nr:3-oxoacyl-[acyl-carrier-protein] reductase [Acidobacteriota bacterium]
MVTVMKGKIAIITGASQGIGREIALVLASEGVRCGLFARNLQKLEAVASDIMAAGGPEAICCQVDVSKAEAADAAVKQFIEKAGGIDFLVNNAGCTRDNLLLRMKNDDWDEVIATDLSGVFYITRAALRPMLRARGGRIVTITSVVGEMGNAGQSNYAAAKAGIIGFTKSVAREVGSRSITVNAVAPGYIDTEMTSKLTDEVKKAFVETVPLARMGTAADVAGTVKFLVSDAAAYITGQVIGVNGGMYM